METACPADNTQSMTLAVHGEMPVETIRVRFGPFAADCHTAVVTLNGETLTLQTQPCGDAHWAWLEIPAASVQA